MHRAEVLDRTGHAYTVLWRWMQRGEFPRAHDGGDGSLVWFEDEIEAWMESRPIKQFKSDKIKAAKMASA
jgi:predicted DNA-binding transcriptional regulator AlpA